MKLILSPSKRQNVVAQSDVTPYTVPEFSAEAQRIAKVMKGYSEKVLQKRLGVSEKLSADVHLLWQNWNEEDASISAIDLFQGDVYDGLDLKSMSAAHQKSAQNQLIILSALYGVLRGSDRGMAYRLDLNDSVTVANKSLLVFWKTKVSAFLGKLEEPIIDLSSQEYKALITPDVAAKMLRIDFKEEKGGKLKTVSFFSKKSRGTFARWVIENEVDDLEDLKKFNIDGYKFNHTASDQSTWIFSRKSDS